MKAAGLFPISEKREKELIITVSVGFSFLSLVFSLLSVKANEFSLYYAGGVLASLNALIFFSYLLALALIVPTLISLWYLHRANKEPNQPIHPTPKTGAAD